MSLATHVSAIGTSPNPVISASFGAQPTAHLFMAKYGAGAWHEGELMPFQNLSLSPMALCLHYGQTVFEGMKAFPTGDGKINIFRMQKHWERFNKSLDRMCMPGVSFEMFSNAITQLIHLDRAWMPDAEDASLYIRPFMIATEARIGVKVAEEYLFMVVCSPAGKYYAEPLKVKVETRYSRAADEGTGYAKCGGNYGGAFYPTAQARAEGYDQVIWTDSKEHAYIEESGTMNIVCVIDGTIITPALSGTILDGVTRSSLLTIARDKGIAVEERRLKVSELQAALEAGKRVELFGAGTAAVVAPIAQISIGDNNYHTHIAPDALMYTLRDALNSIRQGKAADSYGWNTVV
ncbi:MAG: branched-chain amino acid aminotransferase [Chitinophagia bacterium]|nr:branched-chain amino acid aminotransferase [Chitinophagia bacterium]